MRARRRSGDRGVLGARRSGIGVTCVVVLLLSGLAACTSGSKPRPTQGPRALADTLTPVWSADVADLDQSPDIDGYPEASFSSRAAVLPNLNQLEIRAASTGQMLHDVAVGEQVGGVAIAGDVVVAQTGRASGLNFDFSSLRAYDLSSGRQLWSRNIRTGHVLQPGRYDLPISGPAIVTTRGVVVFSRNEQDLFGLDLRTGQQRWTRKTTCGQGTTPTTVSATATTAVVLSHCSGKSALSLVNPQNGDTHTIDVSAATDISTTPTAFAVISSGSLSVFAASGKLLGRVQGGLPGRGNTRFVQVNGDQAVIFSGDELRAISLSHGNELWRRTIEGRVSRYVPPRVSGQISGWGTVGDLVVVNQAIDPQRPGPGASSIAYPSGKITPLIPWPVSGMFVGAVPGMVFAVSHAGGKYRFTALRPDRKGLPDPSLGGAKPTDWPDPCQLLTSSQLATLGPGYTAVPAAPSPVAGRLHLPHTDQCNFGDGKRPFSLRVAWVAADPAAAQTLTQSLLPPPDFVRPIGTNGYQYSGTTEPAADQAIVVHGRLVIAVHAPQQVALTPQIATLLQTTTP
jgi:hypothetical protein